MKPDKHRSTATDDKHPGQTLPFTDLQQAYWIGQTNLFGLGSTKAHVYGEYEWKGLDLARLERAVQRFIERHEMLRAVTTPDGQLRILDEVPPFRIDVVDLRGQGAEAQERAIQALRAHMLHHGISTDTWPLLEVTAHVLDDERVRLHCNISLLIYDGPSGGVLTDELPLLYADPDAELEPVEKGFRDYVQVLADMAASEHGERSRAYWWARIPNLPPAPPLPLVKAPEQVQNPRFRQLRGVLSPATWARLHDLSRAAKLSPNMLVCTAYTDILATWSGTSHLLVNVMVSQRRQLGPAGARFFGNGGTTIPLEVMVDETPFLERALRLQDQLREDLRHSGITGVEILREINRTHGGSARPGMPVVFATTLDMVSSWKEPQVTGGLEVPQVWLDHQIYRYSDGSVALHWDVVEELFPPGMIDDMFAAYMGLLERLAHEDGLLHEPIIPLTPKAHVARRAQVNATEAPVSSEMLHTLVSARAAEAPAHTAVISRDRRLTYGELEARARHLGSLLQQRGARPNQLVAVVMNKGWEQVVAALGVLHAGAAYLPIDPAVPEERLRYLIEHGQVAVALTQSHLDDALPWPEGLQRIAVDALPAGGAPAGPAPRPVQKPQDLAYVIFTSGSTGLPKGVMIDHVGAVNTILDINQRFGVGPADRTLALSALNFDLSVYDVFGPLAAGGAIVIPDDAHKRDPGHWAELVSRERVTLWNSVPALMEMMMDAAGDGPADALRSLRVVLMSGDWIPVTLPDRIRSAIDGVQVISLGGATEGSIWSIIHPIGAVDPAWTSIPYGKPLVNQRMHVLNALLEPCPEWVPGEIYIGGVGVAKGYLRDEERTRAQFFVHPRTGERLYRTGDHGRCLPDGNIEFLGRKDFQVKVQGYRIELGEIDAALERHPEVRAAVTAVHGATQSTRRLVAYVVPQQQPGPDMDALRDFLASKLPDYMVPSLLIPLDSLPLSSNGKVDRGKLPRPEQTGASVSRDRVAPATPLEAELVTMWECLLDVRPIGVTDNFFSDLGGQSLLAVRMIAQIKKRWGRELPLASLLQRPTVRELAEVLEEECASGQRGDRSRGQCPTLVAIQPLGPQGSQGSQCTGRPVFFAHPVGGNVLCYAGLSGQLGAEQPFYALQSVALAGATAADRTIEDMARRYVAALRAVQPEGPYLLGGWSMGGTIALEMAHQLRAQGAAVDRLVMIDSHLYPERPLDRVGLLAWFARDLFGAQVGAQVDAQADAGGTALAVTREDIERYGAGDGLCYILEQARRANVVSPDVELAQLARLFDVFEANARALVGHVPRRYPGPITYLRARETCAEDFHDGGALDCGWGAYATEPIDVHLVPGNHYTMFLPPNLQTLAQRIREALAAT